MMKKNLLNTVLIVSAIGFYNGDSAVAGNMDCAWMVYDCANTYSTCNSFKKSIGGAAPTEAQNAAAEACVRDLESHTLGDGKDLAYSCEKACREKLLEPGHCIQGIDCTLR